MEYNINPCVFSNVFVFPVSIADKYLKLCRGEHLKVLIYIMRSGTQKPSVAEISEALEISEYDVKEAILFWADAGILLTENTAPSGDKTPAVKKVLKPTREDIAKRGLEDPKIKYLLAETQLKFGRNLKNNEAQTLVYLYDDMGLEVSLILFIVEYAKQREKVNIRFIEALASDWLDKGIETIAEAEEEVRQIALREQAWGIVCRAFGIELRKPTKKETELSNKWINEWKISKELLEKAYEVCVDSKSKFVFSYTAKIIENWHNQGYKKPEDIKAPQKSDTTATYDIDLFEKMLNSKE